MVASPSPGAACGGGGGNAKAEFVSECVKESGESKETCECQANAMADALGDKNFSKMVTLAKNDDEDGAEKMMMELVGEDPAVAMKMGAAMMTCAS